MAESVRAQSKSIHYTLGRRAYDLLLESLLTGKYEAGQRLGYEEVSRDLGVSLTPVKEAFLRLEEQGLLVSVAHRGTYVRKFLRKDIEEIYQLREMIEGLSARLACRSAEQKDLKDLRAMNAKLKRYLAKKDIKNSIQTDIQIHERIAELSENSRLVSLLKGSVLTNLFRISEREEVFLVHGEEMILQHERIIDSIEGRSEEQAEQRMREQIRAGAEWILRSLSE